MTYSLPQRERSVAYQLTVDQYVNAIGAHAERTRTQIVDVLAAINPEVHGIRGPAVNGLVDLLVASCARSIHSDRRGRPDGHVGTPSSVSVNFTGTTPRLT